MDDIGIGVGVYGNDICGYCDVCIVYVMCICVVLNLSVFSITNIFHILHNFILTCLKVLRVGYKLTVEMNNFPKIKF